MRFSITQMLIVVACICLVLGALLHGYYLLGTTAGVVFALLAAATLFVFIRVISSERRFHRLRVAVALILAMAVFTILAIPAQLNSDLGYLIDGHQIERVTRSQLLSLIHI